jgi:subtilisin family serine protease
MQPSYFSNLGQEPGSDNGVATFSGDGVPVGMPATIELETITLAAGPGTPGGSRTDGVEGVFTAEHLPTISDPGKKGHLSNRAGWVYWAGTSFAAPIVSAIAANLLAEDHTLSADDVREAIRGFAVDRTAAKSLGVNTIFAKQVQP